ncbi:MAG: amidohydrolase family protein [Holophaga sp.]|jgi:5-methylthioadenosine/S-adenosylhomocysteine deaminase
MKVDTIVKAPHFYTLEGEGVGYRTGIAMVVDRGKIVDLADAATVDQRYQAEETLALGHHVVLPGLIDAHMHTGCCILRGVAQDTRYWMMYGLEPYSNVVRPQERHLGTRLAVLEAIKAGTTTLGDYDHDMGPVCELIAKVGARGNLTQVIREVKHRVYHPGELYPFTPELGRQSLEDNLALFDRWHGEADGRIRILLGPQGADFLSEGLLLEVQRQAKARGTRIHMHVQQGDRETWQIQARCGKRPIEWLQSIGYLDETLIAVHLTDADDQEAAVVARSGASMVLCPGSIAIIDGIVPPSEAFQAAGGPCALGSDQAAGNNCHNMFNEMKLVCLLNKVKYRDPERVPAWKALRMATIEGARALGLGEAIGSLEVGKRADFIAVDLARPTMMPVFSVPMRNIVPNLVYSARGEEVALAVVDGRTILKDGKVLAMDEEELIAQVERSAESIGERAAPEFWRINGSNADWMREGKL